MIISMDRLECITSIMHIQKCGASVCDLETSPMRWPKARVGLMRGKKKRGGGSPVHLLPFDLTKNW